MKNILLTLMVFGVVGCASGSLTRFPVAQYVDDKNTIELSFACITKSKISCTAGLYLDNMQVYEAYGDYSLLKGGMELNVVYKLKIPPSKYQFSPSGPGNLDQLNRFIEVKNDSCVIYTADTPDYNPFNIFAKLKDNELVWSLIDCDDFKKLTESFSETVLEEPIYFTKQRQ